MSRIADAFDAVRAEQDLKDRTLERVLTSAHAGERVRGHGMAPRLAMVCCSLALALCLGGWVYLTPTAAISLEVNPAVELGINRFDRVVSARGLNEDGEALLAQVDVWGVSYNEAVERLLGSSWVSDVLADGGAADVTVVDLGDASQCERLLAGVEACAAGTDGVRCHAGESGYAYGRGDAAADDGSDNGSDGCADNESDSGSGGGADVTGDRGHAHRHGHHE